LIAARRHDPGAVEKLLEETVTLAAATGLPFGSVTTPRMMPVVA